MVSFAVQKLVSLIRSHLFIIILRSHLFIIVLGIIHRSHLFIIILSEVSQKEKTNTI